MARPILPEWASTDEKDDTSGQFNVVPPPPEKKLVGWFFGEKPNRQWWNWLHRQTYLCLKQIYSEGSSITTDTSGVGLFTVDNAIITIDAVDRANPNNFYRAVGVKMPGLAPTFSATSIQSNVLTLGTGTISGNQPILGGTNVIIKGTSSVTA